MQLIRSIYRANKYSNHKAHLEVFGDECELLKLQISLCANLRIFPYRSYLSQTLIWINDTKDLRKKTPT